MKLRTIIPMFIFIASMAVLSDAQIKPEFSLIHDDGYDYVFATAYSHDGSKIVTSSGSTIVWDANNGNRILALPDKVGCAAFSNDDKLIVGGISHLKKYIWDAKTGKLLYSHQGGFDPSGPIGIRCITFTPKGDKVLYVKEHGELMVWDYQTGEVEFVTKVHSSDEILFFNDSDKVLIIGYVVSLSEKKVLHVFEYSAETIINNDNQVVALMRGGGSRQFYNTVLWDSETYTKIGENPIYESRCVINKISPDGKFVAVGRTKDAQEETRIIDAQTAQVKRKMQNAKDEIPDVDRIVFSPDGKQVALVSKNVVNVYDISDLTSSAQSGEGLN